MLVSTPETVEHPHNNSPENQGLSEDAQDEDVVQSFELLPSGDFFAPSRGTNVPAFFPTTGTLFPNQLKLLEDAWRPVVDFVSNLNSLTDIVYDCVDQMPSALLYDLFTYRQRGQNLADMLSALSLELLSVKRKRALHRKFRLHHFAFTLNSLRMDEDAPHRISEYDYELATSPCVYSLVAWYNRRDFLEIDHTEDAVEAMTAGAAVNLKHVSVQRVRYGHQLPTAGTSRPPWSGFPDDAPSRSGNRHAQSFSLSGDIEKITAAQLTTWRQALSFSALYSLHLTQHCHTIIGSLIGLAQSSSLPTLKDLRLDIHERCCPYPTPETITLTDDRIRSLLSFLPNLTTFHLAGPFSSNILPVVSKGAPWNSRLGFPPKIAVPRPCCPRISGSTT